MTPKENAGNYDLLLGGEEGILGIGATHVYSTHLLPITNDLTFYGLFTCMHITHEVAYYHCWIV
jgi:hypothetical protein